MTVGDEITEIDLAEQSPALFGQYRSAFHLLLEIFAPFDQAVTLTKLQEITFAHCARSIQMLRSIFVLGRYGFGLDCVILTRSLVELTVNAYFLAYEKRRQALHPYVMYGRVEQWENFRKLLEFQKQWNRTPTIEDQLGKQRIRELRRAFHKSKKRFLDSKGRVSGSWCNRNLRQRAQFVDQYMHSPGRLEETYVIVNTQLGNPVAHSSVLALSQIPTGTEGARFDASPSVKWVEECLRIGLVCIYLVAQLANNVGRLRRDELVRRIEKACTP